LQDGLGVYVGQQRLRVKRGNFWMCDAAPGRPEPNLVGEVGEVKVDARFDAGYFVTITIGEETFRGTLYYPPPSHVLVLSLSFSGIGTADVSFTDGCLVGQGRHVKGSVNLNTPIKL
jgi:hypothetical protein